MQQKKTNKILIIAVAVIWGVVMYKFATPFFTTTDTVLTAESLVAPLQNVVRKKDTFSLAKLRRDPFLGKIYREKTKSTTIAKPTRKPKVKRKEKPLKNWPNIVYLGYVKSKNSTSKLGLLRINGVLKRVRDGAQVGDINIKSIKEHSVTIQFQKESKDFEKAN